VLLVKDGVNAGDAAINTHSGEISLLSSVAFLRPFNGILVAHFLLTYLQSPVGNKYLLGNLTGTAIRRIILQRIREVPIPIAPISEQTRIAEEVADKLSQIEQAETIINHDLLRAARLRRSILKQAFEGKLAPQDQKDEPANKLLERLRASQSSHTSNGNTVTPPRSRGRRVNSKQPQGQAEE
jgi:type I restriction enzyme, S subunit